MPDLVILFIGIMLALMLIGWIADQRAAKGDANVTPGLKLLPGDIEYTSPSGNVKVYFPVVTSIVASIVLSLLLSWLR